MPLCLWWFWEFFNIETNQLMTGNKFYYLSLWLLHIKVFTYSFKADIIFLHKEAERWHENCWWKFWIGFISGYVLLVIVNGFLPTLCLKNYFRHAGGVMDECDSQCTHLAALFTGVGSNLHHSTCWINITVVHNLSGESVFSSATRLSFRNNEVG